MVKAFLINLVGFLVKVFSFSARKLRRSGPDINSENDKQNTLTATGSNVEIPLIFPDATFTVTAPVCPSWFLFLNAITDALANFDYNFRPSEIQTTGMLEILKQCEYFRIQDPRHVAYIMATAYHESRFKSVKERLAANGTQVRAWQDRYWPSGFYGRGLPQLTWERNYKKYSPVVGIDLVKNPDAVLSHEVGAKILVHGMAYGGFTANGLYSQNRLSRYFNESTEDWAGARAIVNGTFQHEKVTAAALAIFPVVCNRNLSKT